MTHAPQHTATLQAAIEGRLAPTAPELRELLASCAQCAEAWAEHQALVRGLVSAGQLRERVLSAARSVADAPGAAEAERALRDLIRREPAGQAPDANPHAPRVPDPDAEHDRERESPRRPRRWPWIALAAVVLALLGLAWQRGLFDPPPIPVRVLGTEIRCTSPATLERSQIRLAWSGSFAPTTRFDVFVEGRASESAPWQSLGPWTGLRSSPWIPAAEASASWPAQLRWRVEANDDTLGLQLDSGWASLTLLH